MTHRHKATPNKEKQENVVRVGGSNGSIQRLITGLMKTIAQPSFCFRLCELLFEMGRGGKTWSDTCLFEQLLRAPLFVSWAYYKYISSIDFSEFQ